MWQGFRYIQINYNLSIYLPNGRVLHIVLLIDHCTQWPPSNRELSLCGCDGLMVAVFVVIGISELLGQHTLI